MSSLIFYFPKMYRFQPLKNFKWIHHIKPAFHGRFYSIQPPALKSQVRYGVGTIIIALGLYGTVFYSNSLCADEKIMLKSLPEVDVMLSQESIAKILTENELFLKSDSSLVSRIDHNSIASNNPIEDYHSQHRFNDSLIIGIYDGHGGYECAKLVKKYMASYVAHYVSQPIPDQVSKSEHIKSSLQSAFVALDHDILNGILKAKKVSTSWFYPFSSSESDYKAVVRNLKSATSGACAIVAYIDKDDIYVASAGDCRAVIAQNPNITLNRNLKLVKDEELPFISIPLSTDHTTHNQNEFDRLIKEHPGEEETVIRKNRVLGGLQPTRTIGDARYKWPRDIQEVVIPHVYPNKKRTVPKDLKTPPYVTAVPEVSHHKRTPEDSFLVLACDGLWDELSSEKAVQVVQSNLDSRFSGNYSTALIKAAFSGAGKGASMDDPGRIQHILSLKSPQSRRFRDDITVKVIHLGSGLPSRGKEIKSVREEKPTGPEQLSLWVNMLKHKILNNSPTNK
ncbi:phosphatase 2C-like domain-containing protein [Globomyces pollinis-pini]|nr:phosphatase 2C-like domain-containing protein [Globomyces pollinis-pini]